MSGLDYVKPKLSVGSLKTEDPAVLARPPGHLAHPTRHLGENSLKVQTMHCCMLRWQANKYGASWPEHLQYFDCGHMPAAISWSSSSRIQAGSCSLHTVCPKSCMASVGIFSTWWFVLFLGPLHQSPCFSGRPVPDPLSSASVVSPSNVAIWGQKCIVSVSRSPAVAV